MTDYTVKLTDTEDKAMTYACLSTQDWADNALKNRARVAIDKIVSLNMQHCNANGIAIATGEDKQVEQAFTLGVVKTAKQRNDEANKTPE